MSKVYYRRYYDRHLLTVEGHANYGEKGRDIVCAAVSILCYTLLETLKQDESEDKCKIIQSTVRDGYFSLEVEPFSFSDSRIGGIVDAVLTGFMLLEEEYPENVRFE